MELEDGVEEGKLKLWTCLTWADKEEREKIFIDIYRWLDNQYHGKYRKKGMIRR